MAAADTLADTLTWPFFDAAHRGFARSLADWADATLPALPHENQGRDQDAVEQILNRVIGEVLLHHRLGLAPVPREQPLVVSGGRPQNFLLAQQQRQEPELANVPAEHCQADRNRGGEHEPDDSP